MTLPSQRGGVSLAKYKSNRIELNDICPYSPTPGGSETDLRSVFGDLLVVKSGAKVDLIFFILPFYHIIVKNG